MTNDRWLDRQLKLEKTKPWAIALKDRIDYCASVGEMLDDGLGYDDIALITYASGGTLSREQVKAFAKCRVKP